MQEARPDDRLQRAGEGDADRRGRCAAVGQTGRQIADDDPGEHGLAVHEYCRDGDPGGKPDRGSRDVAEDEEEREARRQEVDRCDDDAAQDHAGTRTECREFAALPDLLHAGVAPCPPVARGSESVLGFTRQEQWNASGAPRRWPICIVPGGPNW